MNKQISKALKVAVLLGGPSRERSISLNSARSVFDHLESDDIKVSLLVYFDEKRRAYIIDQKRLYSNTTSDFDFKLSGEKPLTESELIRKLKCDSDIAFPVMHGVFGEDGGVQSLLEEAGVPYVGSGPEACRRAYDKFLAHKALRAAGIDTVPTVLFSPENPAGEGTKEDQDAIEAASKLVTKSATGGSSLGVKFLKSKYRSQLLKKISEIRRKNEEKDFGPRLVLQPRMKGAEFTTVVIERCKGPVALLPIEVEIRCKGKNKFFSYRHKYLSSDATRYHCPPRRSDKKIAAIRKVAEEVFIVLGLRDFARIDCWIDEKGEIVVSDVNPISGMEQNSFLFIQAAEIGMTHSDVLRLVISNTCRRTKIQDFEEKWRRSAEAIAEAIGRRQRVPIFFGGETAERHVSVMSGTNVWFKLMRSERFEPVPYLFENPETVWKLTYPLALLHSANHISEACDDALDLRERQRKQRLAQSVANQLGLEPWQQMVDIDQKPKRLSLDSILNDFTFVFIALHGGVGKTAPYRKYLTPEVLPITAPVPKRLSSVWINGPLLTVSKALKIKASPRPRSSSAACLTRRWTTMSSSGRS